MLRLDLNGASAAWKAVVLLPFLDASKLRAAFETILPKLSQEEAARNRFGPTYLYVPPHDRLAPELWSLVATHAKADGYAMAKVAQPVVSDEGLAALLTPYPAVPDGARREPPSAKLTPIPRNRVASAVLRLPPQRLHVSNLLQGVVVSQTLHPAAVPQTSHEEHYFRRSLSSLGRFQSRAM